MPALNVYSEMPSLPFYRVLQIQINEPLIQESRTQEERAGGKENILLPQGNKEMDLPPSPMVGLPLG